MFTGLALVCDEYFVPALDRISEGIKYTQKKLFDWQNDGNHSLISFLPNFYNEISKTIHFTSWERRRLWGLNQGNSSTINSGWDEHISFSMPSKKAVWKWKLTQTFDYTLQNIGLLSFDWFFCWSLNIMSLNKITWRNSEVPREEQEMRIS